MEFSTAIQRLHNTHVDSESSSHFSAHIDEDRMAVDMHSDKYHHKSIPSGFSFIIDDVDAEPKAALSDASDRRGNCLDEIYVRDGGTLVDTNSAHSKERSDARIQQIKGEAESRKNEFAKLLEEHAQVIKQLKQMEDEPAVSGGEAGPADLGLRADV